MCLSSVDIVVGVCLLIIKLVYLCFSLEVVLTCLVVMWLAFDYFFIVYKKQSYTSEHGTPLKPDRVVEKARPYRVKRLAR